MILPLLFFLSAASPEQRAVEYLTQEVPRWQRENHCYSCHNNGDAARALFAARRAGYAFADDVLSDTVRWLRQPGEWDNNHGNPGFSDTRLARIQFAAALAEAGWRIQRRCWPRRSPCCRIRSVTDRGKWYTAECRGSGHVWHDPRDVMARRTLETAGPSASPGPIARQPVAAGAKPANIPDMATSC